MDSQHFSSTTEIMDAMKEMFRDDLQQVMESELDTELGYEKSQRDISEQIKSLYVVDISPELVSKISEKIMPEVTAWQNRPLEAVYPFVFRDAIHYKVKENHQYQPKAAYVVLGVTMDGTTERMSFILFYILQDLLFVLPATPQIPFAPVRCHSISVSPGQENGQRFL